MRESRQTRRGVDRQVDGGPRGHSMLCCFFFFQAEDGIRDLTVTGVQTCALPISQHAFALEKLQDSGDVDDLQRRHYQYFLSQRWKARDSPNFWAALAWARDNVADRKSVV